MWSSTNNTPESEMWDLTKLLTSWSWAQVDKQHLMGHTLQLLESSGSLTCRASRTVKLIYKYQELINLNELVLHWSSGNSHCLIGLHERQIAIEVEYGSICIIKLISNCYRKSESIPVVCGIRDSNWRTMGKSYEI